MATRRNESRGAIPYFLVYMKNLPNIWLDSLTTFDSVLSEIENCLTILKENALEADFLNLEEKRTYSSNVLFMKQFFERAEFLARGRK
jgi:hypothetical protein